MDSNSPIPNEQFTAMQQRLLQLEQTVAQTSTQPITEPLSSSQSHMDAEEAETLSALHSLSVQPSLVSTPWYHPHCRSQDE
jgi:hypothetical protein